MIDLLPFVEASTVYDQYHQNDIFCTSANANAIQVPLSINLCPSAPDRDPTPTFSFVPSKIIGPGLSSIIPGGAIKDLDNRYSMTYAAAPTDYAVPVQASASLANALGYDVSTRTGLGLPGMLPWPVYSTTELAGKLLSISSGSTKVEFSRRRRVAEVTDGLSNTFIQVESAGRPEHWQNGTRSGIDEPLNGAWSDPSVNLQLQGVWTESGPCLVNCDNLGEIYSFHPSGANFLFSDGHVKTVAANIDPKAVLAWLTPDAGDEAH